MIYAYLDKNIKAANTKELTLNQNCSYEKLPVEMYKRFEKLYDKNLSISDFIIL